MSKQLAVLFLFSGFLLFSCDLFQGFYFVVGFFVGFLLFLFCKNNFNIFINSI